MHLSLFLGSGICSTMQIKMSQAPSCAGLQKFTSHTTSMISPSFADNELRKVSRSALSGVITVSTVFSKDGRFIYMGQSKGFLSVLDANSLQFLDVLKVRVLHASPAWHHALMGAATL